MTSKQDVIIVGAGAAGLSAALQVKDEGKNPIVLEKMPEPRGNTKGASAGMNAAMSKFQKQQGIEDSLDDFYKETLVGGKNKNNTDLLRFFVEHAAEAIDWLDEKGICLDNLTQVGGMSVKRTHRPTDGSPIGAYLLNGLLDKVNKADIPVLVNTEVKALLTENQKVIGVVAEQKGVEKTFETNAVIFTTGGFGANKQMVGEWVPKFASIETTNYPSAQGQGLQILENVGAELIDLSAIQIHPTMAVNKRFLITEAVRGEGAILLNADGQRFCNELDTRDVVSKAIHNLPERSAYLVFDQKVRERVPAINFYASQGLVEEAGSIEELAKKCGMDVEQAVETVKSWNEKNVEELRSDEFGKNLSDMKSIDGPNYLAIHITPGVHHTMGGVHVTTKSEVILKDNQEVLKGCYAAGEVVGGLHGDNRIGGNAIAETVVFGRQAGKQATQYVMNL